MTETNFEYASTAIVTANAERLREKKAAIETQLALVSLKLIELSGGPESEPKPITARVHTGYYEYKDDGYIGGHVLSSWYPERNLEITANYFETIYLAALAKQGNPVPSSLPETPTQWGTESYGAVTIERLEIDGQNPASDTVLPRDHDYDTSDENEYRHYATTLRSFFDNAKPAAIEVVQALREQVTQNNPYRDIPIKINHSDLIDALLRTEILKYCETHDSNFSVEDVTITS